MADAIVRPLDREALLVEQIKFLSDTLAERLNNAGFSDPEAGENATLINVINEKAKTLETVLREISVLREAVQ